MCVCVVVVVVVALSLILLNEQRSFSLFIHLLKIKVSVHFERAHARTQNTQTHDAVPCSTTMNDASNSTTATALPQLDVFAVSSSNHQKSPPNLSGFVNMSNFAVKLKRKAAQVKRKSRAPAKNSPTSPKTSLIPSNKVYTPASPVKYTDRPERLYRRVPFNHQDVPKPQDLELARYEGRPQATAYPEFDGKIQLPPVTMSNTSFYKTPEERSLPVQFAEPEEDRLCKEGVLYCQDLPEQLFYPVFGFVDITVPVFFCFENSEKTSYKHIRDIRGHSSKIIGWRKAPTENDGEFKCFCFEMYSVKNIGTGNETLTFGTPHREVAYAWLNYIRRSSRHYIDAQSVTFAKQHLCPIAPPPTRRYRNLWPSFFDVATTTILIEDDGDVDGTPQAKDNAVVDNSNTPNQRQSQTQQHSLRTTTSAKQRTVQDILLDMGLIMDEQWVGGPATVFTIENRAALHLQTWYRFKSAHYLVNGPYGLLRKQWAARVVQRRLRGWRIRRRLRRTKESATVIQRHWRHHRMARNVLQAKKEMDQKIKRAKAYFLDSARMRVVLLWKQLTVTSLRAKDICRRALFGNIQYTFDKWCGFVDFRRQVQQEKNKQDKKEKERRAMFFIKKMVYRHAATAIHSWKSLVERNKRVRSLLKRHMSGLLENHFTSWLEYVQKLQKARKICKRVLLGVEKNRWDDWRHFIHGRKAARVVQSCWRGFTAYRNYLVLLRWQQYASSCAYIIQSSWRIHVAWQATWGSGGVFVKMNASRLIQSLWRGYIKQKTYQSYLHKIRLLQGRCCYWLHRRRSAAIFIQYQWRRYWNWKIKATAASTLIQTQIRRYFVQLDVIFQKEDIYSSFQWDGVVLRGAVNMSDRYGAMHRVLCTAKHVSGTLRFVFVDPRTCIRDELFFRTMQLIQLTEERWSVRRHMHDIASLAQVVLDLVIVLNPGTPQTEYILRPQMLSAFAQTSKAAFPLRSPRAVTKHDILPTQVQFWNSVYTASALSIEGRLPIGPTAQQLVLDMGETDLLRNAMVSINDYCGEEDADERLAIAESVIRNDLETLLQQGDDKNSRNDNENGNDNENEDDNAEKETETETEQEQAQAQEQETYIATSPALVLKHSYTLATLLVGLHRTPLDIFDRVEHRGAEILMEQNKKATKAFGEFAQNRGMRPPTREAAASSTSLRSTLPRWNSVSSAIQWEVSIENSLSELHTVLDTTQQMETPFVNIRETFEQAVSEQEYLRDTSCYLLQLGADDLTNYLATAGAVNSTTDMMIRARIAAFIDQCEDKIQLLQECVHIQQLHQAIALFVSLEEMRSTLLTAAFESEAHVYPALETLQEQKRCLIGSFFAKQRAHISVHESAVLETANHVHLFLIPHLDEIINRCVCAAEDFKSVLFEMGPALEELKERAHMHREDIEAWYAQVSLSIIGDRDALNAEIAAKQQSRLEADLAEAARGGKSIEQILKERKETDAANRIARVYRAYLERNDNVNAGGVWSELQYNGKILITCLDVLVQVLEDEDEESYELAMIQSLQMRVHKLSEQIVLRTLGPCMKHAHVVEKRWPIVLGLVERWEEEARIAALKALDPSSGAFASSEEDSDSSWDSDDSGDDNDDDTDTDDETDSDDDSEDGGFSKEKAQELVARSNVLPNEIHSKLRVLWRAHLSTIQKERDRQAAVRAAQFGPRMKRKMVAGAKFVGRTLANSGPVKLTARQLNKISKAIKNKLHSMQGYQAVKLQVALFGYNHLPQYFAIPEGVKEKKSVQIQKRVRGMLARMLAHRMAEARDEKAFDFIMNSAAIKIQTLFRYFAARKYTLELVRVSYNKIYDDKASKWCYHNTVADSYTYTKPNILGDALDLPTPRSKARGMKWSAGYYVEKSKKSAHVTRKLVLTNTVAHVCNHPSCNLMEEVKNSFVQCPRCKVKYYCGRPHQLNHLDQHGDECEIIVQENRMKRAQQRAADKMGITVADLNLSTDSRTDVERAKDKQLELFKLEKLIDNLKKGLIDQEQYTNALRELKDL